MKGKMIAIIGVVVLLFVLLFVANSYKTNKKLSENDNPYDKTDLRQETVDLLGDPLYDNIIVPSELKETIESGDPLTVYYFSPTCTYCQKTTPVLVPITEDMDVDMRKLNTLEYGMKPFGIEATPTLVHYDDGAEVSRLVGQQEEAVYRDFFDKFVK